MDLFKNLSKIDLNKIVVFAQVVEAGSFHKASDILNVTPSALSQTIKSLEHNLGLNLFHRTGKRLIPTEAALKLYKEFSILNLQFFNSLSEIKGEKQNLFGLLKIGSYLEFAKLHLPSILQEFLKEFPQSQVKLTFDTPSRLQKLLADGQLDLCFSIFPATDNKLILSYPVFKQELVLISPKALLSDQSSFDQVCNTPMIEYFFNHEPIRRWIFLNYKKRPKKIPVRIYAASAEMVLALVKKGLGIGVVPAYLVENDFPTKTYKIIRPTEEKLIDHIWLLEKSQTDKTVLYQNFVNLCKTKITLNSILD